MREIKFRAWDNVGLKMLEDYEDIFDQGPNIYIMQYTGLKDKNGKEIYEWDIVKIYNCVDIKTNEKFEHTFTIEWNKYTFAYNSSDVYMPLSDYNLGTLEDYDIEIIGNIYENPNLLNKD